MPTSTMQGSRPDDRASYVAGMEHLLTVVQELSSARDIARVTEIVRTAARVLANADGATFVLREGELCHYADEDAIEPLWKGRRFPMSACVSGWVMEHRESVVIPDVYADPRVPADAYRPTFVKSMAMVPIRRSDPLGAIGVYWARSHQTTAEELRLLQALADSTSIAIEHAQLYLQLEQRVHDRTAQVEASRKELEAFSYSVSHDLRAPLRAILGFSRALEEDHGAELSADAKTLLGRILGAGARMGELIDELLNLSRLTRAEIERERIDLTETAHFVMRALRSKDDRVLECTVDEGLYVDADRRLLQILLENLLSNAWKFTRGVDVTRIHVGRDEDAREPTYFVRDNGVGFDMQYAHRLFRPFERLHSRDRFPGTGVGLATAQRIVARHGGRIWVESQPSMGTIFRFTLPAEDRRQPRLVVAPE